MIAGVAGTVSFYSQAAASLRNLCVLCVSAVKTRSITAEAQRTQRLRREALLRDVDQFIEYDLVGIGGDTNRAVKGFVVNRDHEEHDRQESSHQDHEHGV